MAEVIRLRADEKPPEREKHVLVARDEVGHPDGGSLKHSLGKTFYVPYPYTQEENDETVRRAQAFANQHGIRAVYVIGL
jgi:hypothetical protein